MPRPNNRNEFVTIEIIKHNKGSPGGWQQELDHILEEGEFLPGEIVARFEIDEFTTAIVLDHATQDDFYNHLRMLKDDDGEPHHHQGQGMEGNWAKLEAFGVLKAYKEFPWPE